MKGEYLSNIVDINDIKSNCLNLIYAPCGSGKTTFAKTELINLNHNLWNREMLYLIDSAMGKEQLLQSEGCIWNINYWTGEDMWILPDIRVMTYAGYATLCQKAPNYDAWQKNALIICDELHNEIGCSKWNKDENIHKSAIDILKQRINIGNNTVVAMSATPALIKREFSHCLNEIPLYGEPRHYENNQVTYYSNLSLLLKKIKPTQRGVIYSTRVKELLKYKEITDRQGLKTAALWSTNNADHPLNNEQLKIRDYIIRHKEIPDYINLLFVNKAFETSISMGNNEATKNPIDFMIIHTSDKDVQTQMRGRYRNDLNELFLFRKEKEEEIILERKWLFKPLLKEDKDALCVELGFKDKNGRLLKWTSIKSKLTKSGYIIEEGRNDKVRYSTILEL